MIRIDGSEGEGGGQVLRTSLSLAAVTGTEFFIERIRARRARPGLLRQHLTAVQAMAQVCGASVSGAELGSTGLRFAPSKVSHGNYHFAVGTAGSATLVLQTILPALLLSEGESIVVVEGGTHNTAAPPFPFLDETFLPLLRNLGAEVELSLERHGFYPAGGGRLRARIAGGRPLGELTLTERVPIQSIDVCAVISGVPRQVAERELEAFRASMPDFRVSTRILEVHSQGPGNVLIATVKTPGLVETFTAFGERGVRAEAVAHNLVGEVQAYLASDAPVGEHLADQLLLPLSLARGGQFLTQNLSQHTLTNRDVIERFLGKSITFEPSAAGGVLVNVQRGQPPSPV
jgi:RNA 3'-terminal phosphate cyclase (ATP)